MYISDILNESASAKAVDRNTQLSNELSTKPVIIFGCGNLGKKIYNFLLPNKYNLVGWADNNQSRWDTTLNDIPVLSPAKAAELYGSDALFVISIWSPGNSYVKTKQQLEGLGIKNIVHAASLMQLFPNDLLPHYHFQTADYFLKHKKELLEVYNLLEDAESKQQYLAHIDCRINLNFDGLPAADIYNQYFPSDVIKLGENETFFDAGAYDGDTLRDFCANTNNKYTKYIALEPDPQNKVKLENRIKALNAHDVSVFTYAVGADNCTLKFDATGGGGAGISQSGTLEVECVRIDDKFFNEKPTYLKFDIEGAELDALSGTEKTIEAYHPKLAVCIYHLPDDLWNIPLYLKRKYPFYKFFVRTHQFDGLDFVLYAVPQ